MDTSVGQVFDLLKELKLDGDTIVFFSSDNGAQAGVGTDPVFFNGTGGLRGYKTTMYEGGIRTPMIVRWPGKIKAGTVSPHVWYFTDVLPTLAALAGVEAPKGIDGLSVTPTLLGDASKQKQHDYLYWELPQYNAMKARAFAPGADASAVHEQLEGIAGQNGGCLSCTIWRWTSPRRRTWQRIIPT